MRKLLGWTVGLVAILPLALMMGMAKWAKNEDQAKNINRMAYALGLTDVQE